MSDKLSFKTLAKVTSPAAGTFRVATDGELNAHFKFVGDKGLSLEEVVALMQAHTDYEAFTVNSLVSKRSGYKYKTTWTV